MNMAEQVCGQWYARAWTSHAATTVVVDDPTVLLGRRVIAECEDEQTARLVAEAPALLSALQALLHEFGRTYLPGSSDSVDAARVVLGRVGIECPISQVRR
ncbi:MAG TPA: hypothetical protein PKA20_05750 [Burkholderiaceae bacterium]|nr:hypothetical protein [Burkholderiaceae bacterium]